MENNKASIFGELHIPIILRDILRNLWVSVLAAAIICMGVYVYGNQFHQPEYTSEVTFSVSPKSNGSYVGFYSSLNTANEMTSVFKEVFGSDVLKRLVKEDLSDPSIPVSVTANVEEGTNILKVSVTAETPLKAHALMQSVLDNYGQVSTYLFGGVVLDAIKTPHVPTEPSNTLDMPLLMVIGALVVWFSIQRDTVKTLRSAKRSMGESPVGVLVLEKRFQKSAWKKKQKKKGLLITQASVSFRYVEAMLQIAHKIAAKMRKNGNKTLLITSVAENEGKSTVAANLAIALAKHGNRVALVDMDLRRPALHKFYQDHEAKQSLVKCLETGFSPVESWEKWKLQVLTLEGFSKNPGQLIHSKKLKDLLAQLKESADFVILDSAPYMAVADTGLLLQNVDCSLMVLRQDWVPEKMLESVAQELSESDAVYMGYILNYYLDDGAKQATGQYYSKYSSYSKYGYYKK